MTGAETKLPPPPPPKTVTLRDIEELEKMILHLEHEMVSTNIRRRFKMVVYKMWCDKITNIRKKIQELRGNPTRF